MEIPPFEMERWQSLWENSVRHNLSESGVAPFRLGELLELTGLDPLDTMLGYGHTEGSPTLRERIAAMYPGATADDVLVTCGSAEANFITCWQLVEPGDRVVIVTPTYGQTPGLAAGLGAETVELRLEEANGWQPSPGSAEDTIREGTRLVVITNPNNPTGVVLSESARQEIRNAAERVGAWILSDEVYAGAELQGPVTPTEWGRSSRVVATASLSKAYGLPGLRVGWAVTSSDRRGALWARKDYTTIAPSVLCDRLAAAALEPEIRRRILSRSRRILTSQLGILADWVDDHDSMLRFRPPDAGAIAFVGYDLDVPRPSWRSACGWSTAP